MADASVVQKASGAGARRVETFDRKEFLRRLEEVKTIAGECASESEDMRRLSPKIFKAYMDRKLNRIAQPPMYGGAGLDMDEVYDIAFEVARADASAAWNLAFYSLHAFQIGMLSKEAQDEIFSETYDPIMVTASAKVKADIEDRGGTVYVNGEWDFCSGADEGQWVQVSWINGTDARQLMIPFANVEVIDNWHVTGMRATGSKRVRIKDAVVPPHMQLTGAQMASGDTTGRKLHPSDYYKLPTFSWMGYVIAINVVGAAQGMLDLFTEASRTRFEHTTGSRFIEREANQVRLAEATAEINAARKIFQADIARFHELAKAGDQPSMQERAMFRLNQAYISRLAVQATNRMFEVGGAGAFFRTNPAQRFFSDAHFMAHHIVTTFDPVAEQYAKVVWELPPKSFNL